MTSSTTKCTLLGASAPQPPDFLLALLAACFSIAATGNDGEAILSDQVLNLLQDKVMAVEELKLLYIYRFGFSIDDALKFLGVHSDLKDYFDQQTRFSMHDGCVSLISLNTTTNEEASADNDPACTNYGYDGDDEMASNAESNSTSDEEEVDDTPTPVAVPWEVVGARIGAALRATCNEEFDDTPARVVVPWMVVGARIGAALHAVGNEEVDDVPSVAVAVPWKVVGARIGAALRVAENDEVDGTPAIVAMPWKVVGARVGAALHAAATEQGIKAFSADCTQSRTAFFAHGVLLLATRFAGCVGLAAGAERRRAEPK